MSIRCSPFTLTGKPDNRRRVARSRFERASGAAVFLFAACNSSIARCAPREFEWWALSLSLSLSSDSRVLCAMPRRRYAWHTFRTRGTMPVDTSSSDGTRTFPVAPETQRPAIMSVNRRRCDRPTKQCAIVANLFHYR